MRKQIIQKYLWVIIVWVLINLALLTGLAHAQSDTLTLEKKKVIDKNFIAVSSYLILTTVFDIETTFAVIHNGGHEENALMKPLFKSGRPAVYAVQLGIDALIIYLSYEMKKSKHKEFNQTWWVAPMVIGTTHGICGGLNLRYAF